MNSKKKSIIENDLILILVENRPLNFARVENISPDIKPGWWRVKLLVLQMPIAITTWILNTEQLSGAEFTMNGILIRIEKVIVPKTNESKNQKTVPPTPKKVTENHRARILTLTPADKKM